MSVPSLPSLSAARPTGARLWLAVALLVVAAGGAGWLLARAVRPAPAPPPGPVTIAGPRLRITVDPSWRLLDRGAAPPGIPAARSVRFSPFPGLPTVVAAAVLPAAERSLLPRELSAHAGTPLKQRVAGLQGWRYPDLQVAGWSLDVIAMPTTRGVLTLACASPPHRGAAPPACFEGVRRLQVPGARPLVPADDTVLRLRLGAVMGPLERARGAGRTALRRAHGPIGQARAARALWRAHLAAARALAPIVPSSGPRAALPGELRSVAAAYRRLALAAANRSPRQWARARTAVHAAERRLARALR